jgi:hypothetical protein
MQNDRKVTGYTSTQYTNFMSFTDPKEESEETGRNSRFCCYKNAKKFRAKNPAHRGFFRIQFIELQYTQD